MFTPNSGLEGQNRLFLSLSDNLVSVQKEPTSNKPLSTKLSTKVCFFLPVFCDCLFCRPASRQTEVICTSCTSILSIYCFNSQELKFLTSTSNSRVWEFNLRRQFPGCLTQTYLCWHEFFQTLNLNWWSLRSAFVFVFNDVATKIYSTKINVHANFLSSLVNELLK